MYINLFMSLTMSCIKICYFWYAWVALLVKRLPSAQVMILESWDPVPHWAPCLAGSLLLPLTLPLLMISLSFSVSQINKVLKKLQKFKKK